MPHPARTAGTRIIGTLLLVLPLVTGVACTKSSSKPPASSAQAPDMQSLSKAVRKMNKRLNKIEKILARYLSPPLEPDPSAVYSMPIEGDPFKGERNAPVTVVKAFEFACGFCFKATSTMTQLLKDYKGKIKIAYKYFIVHDEALAAGLAACAANKQGKFAAFEPLVWEKGFKAQDISANKMIELAKELKLDVKKFDADIKSKDCIDWVRKGQNMLANLGTSGTPAFYINGRFLSGAQPIENFKTLIDEEMAKANKLIAAGTSLESFYQKHVVEKGLKELKKPAEEADE